MISQSLFRSLYDWMNALDSIHHCLLLIISIFWIWDCNSLSVVWCTSYVFELSSLINSKIIFNYQKINYMWFLPFKLVILGKVNKRLWRQTTDWARSLKKAYNQNQGNLIIKSISLGAWCLKQVACQIKCGTMWDTPRISPLLSHNNSSKK